MTYNMTSFESANSVVDIFGAVNTSTGGLLVILSLISIFIILTIILLRNNPPTESIMAASTTCFVISLVFLALGYVDTTWAFGFGAIFGISAIALYLNRQ